MPQKSISSYHVVFMETVLPVGLAIVNRAKKGLLGKVIDGFVSSDLPIQKLKEEGSEDAKSVRMKLDQIIPGLGNPVVEVKVSVNPKSVNNEVSFSDTELSNILNRIESRMNSLKMYLDDSFKSTH